ncbi:expressed unknown protein [Seminavis robusta]|uniref:Uncharacterized protein n=1 Tax=Seminavis robusta TaxID=568900 RepID=A0A9N8HAX5_9STRA|nr:expressed unknown protein [Seminavis robusta]|eukprot:Sro257_g100910.1 n/a (312) ;mRNA; r:58661-59596
MGFLDSFLSRSRGTARNTSNTNNTNTKNHGNNDSSNRTQNDEVHFRVINELDRPISIQIFNEDPDEIQHVRDEESTFQDSFCGSDVFNGHEPLSVESDIQPGQVWTYQRTCSCPDCHVGTIKVDSHEKSFYVDAVKCGRRSSCLEEDASKSSTRSSSCSMDDSQDLIVTTDDMDDDHSTSSRSFTLAEEAVMEVEVIDAERTVDGTVVVNLILKNVPSTEQQGSERNRMRLSQGTLEASLVMLECNFRFNGANQIDDSSFGDFTSSRRRSPASTRLSSSLLSATRDPRSSYMGNTGGGGGAMKQSIMGMYS